MKISLVTICLLFTFSFAQAQEVGKAQKRLLQMSGLVVGGDSAYGIPGVHVYIPKAGRGTVSSHIGYFSMPAFTGDSVVIRSVGYQEKLFVVPDDAPQELSVIIKLDEDTAIMPTITIFPYPTERVFKEAFLALKLPQADMDNMHKNLNEQVMKRMLYNTKPDGVAMHRYYMEQQAVRQEMRFYSPTFQFLNPFAWARFIQSVKQGDLRRKDYEEYSEDDGSKNSKKKKR